MLAFGMPKIIELWFFIYQIRQRRNHQGMSMADADIAVVRIVPETSFKNKAYEALKEAILKMDIYATPEPVMLDERALSERLGVSRTPIREAIAMLEQDGFVKTVPRRGIIVVRRTKNEIVDMIRAWAALESMAARLITTTARKKDISALRDFFRDFDKDRLPQDHVDEYSKANIAFHQALIALSESPVLVDMTNDILLHVRGYRQLTIGRIERMAASLPEHMAIIEALEQRDTELAERLARDHTLGLASFVEAHARNCFRRPLLSEFARPLSGPTRPHQKTTKEKRNVRSSTEHRCQDRRDRTGTDGRFSSRHRRAQAQRYQDDLRRAGHSDHRFRADGAGQRHPRALVPPRAECGLRGGDRRLPHQKARRLPDRFGARLPQWPDRAGARHHQLFPDDPDLRLIRTRDRRPATGRL